MAVNRAAINDPGSAQEEQQPEPGAPIDDALRKSLDGALLSFEKPQPINPSQLSFPAALPTLATSPVPPNQPSPAADAKAIRLAGNLPAPPALANTANLLQVGSLFAQESVWNSQMTPLANEVSTKAAETVVRKLLPQLLIDHPHQNVVNVVSTFARIDSGAADAVVREMVKAGLAANPQFYPDISAFTTSISRECADGVAKAFKETPFVYSAAQQLGMVVSDEIVNELVKVISVRAARISDAPSSLADGVADAGELNQFLAGLRSLGPRIKASDPIDGAAAVLARRIESGKWNRNSQGSLGSYVAGFQVFGEKVREPAANGAAKTLIRSIGPPTDTTIASR